MDTPDDMNPDIADDAAAGVDLPPREKARRAGLTAAGVGLVVVGGPVVGVLTPMFPLGFVVAGVGAGLVVRNSPRGKRVVEAAWAKYPRVTDKCPPKVRVMIFGAETRDAEKG